LERLFTLLKGGAEEKIKKMKTALQYVIIVNMIQLLVSRHLFFKPICSTMVDLEVLLLARNF
jgi:hypothetical protein